MINKKVAQQVVIEVEVKAMVRVRGRSLEVEATNRKLAKPIMIETSTNHKHAYQVAWS